MSEAKKFRVIGVKNRKDVWRTAQDLEDSMNELQAEQRDVQIVKNKYGILVVGRRAMPPLSDLLEGFLKRADDKGTDACPEIMSACTNRLLNHALDAISTREPVAFARELQKCGPVLVRGWSAQELATASEELELEIKSHANDHPDPSCSYVLMLGSLAKFAKESARLS